MKIKSSPDDFCVTEIAKLELKERGSYACYLLEKRGWNTVELLRHLSKAFSIPFTAFSYGGRKDRQSVSKQYITIKHAKSFSSASKTYKLSPIGFLERPMGPDLILENEFRIICRSINPGQEQTINESLQRIQAQGFPNYFDDQRFGSFDPLSGLLGEKILKNHFSGALKILLTVPTLEDTSLERKRKSLIRDCWGKWEQCLKASRTEFEIACFRHLSKKKNDFLGCLRKIPGHDLAFHFSVYQSYLWNRLLGMLLKELLKESYSGLKGKTGEYLFYPRLQEETFSYLKQLKIPLAWAQAKMPDSMTAGLYKDLLAQEGLRQGMFNNLKTRQSFFCRAQRQAIVLPHAVTHEWGTDDTDRGQRKLALRFRLPAGSFATMLLKGLLLDA